MPTVITRTWTARGANGRRVKRIAFGYDLTLPDGRRERKFSSEWDTEEAGQIAMADRLKALAAGVVEVAPPERRTLGEIAEEYLTYKTDQGKRSIREDRRLLKRRLLPAFGADLPARQLTGAMVAQYERRRLGEVSPFTVSNELGVLRHMLRLARRWGYLETAPDIELPKKPEGRLRYLDETEIGKLLEGCARSRNPYLSAIVTLALNTGMRKGEILGLEWERVDLSADYGLSARLTLYRTKSGKPRGIPLNRASIDALTVLAPKPEQRVGRIFTKRDDRAWGQIRTAFTGALDRAGIKAFRFHDLRHTFASHFVMRGGSLRALQEILGHSDYKMTLRYSHLSPAHLRADVDRLDGLTTTKAVTLARPPNTAPAMTAVAAGVVPES